jgi:hypothetical protein
VGDGLGVGFGEGEGDGVGVGEWVGDGEALGEDVAAVPPPHATTPSNRKKLAAARSVRIAINGNDRRAHRIFG